MYHTSYFWLFAALILCILCYCAIMDIRWRRIPNTAVLMILGLALLHAAMAGMMTRSLQPLIQGLLGLLSGVLPFALIILVSRGGMGAGDMKLFGAVGAFLGLRMTIEFILLTILLAGAASALWLLSGQKDRKAAIPLAPFMTGAFIIIVVFQPWIAGFLGAYYGI